MNPRTDKERLLADVLHAEPDAEFGSNVLTETLRGVRRQRRVRQVQHYSLALAAIMVVTFFSTQLLRQPTAPGLANSPKPLTYQLVATQPLPAGQIAATRAFVPDQPVTTASVSLIETDIGGFGEIGDDELISLAAPNVVVLVRRGPHEAELVFVSAPAEGSSTQQN
jgi:hypothetical protein